MFVGDTERDDRAMFVRYQWGICDVPWSNGPKSVRHRSAVDLCRCPSELPVQTDLYREQSPRSHLQLRISKMFKCWKFERWNHVSNDVGSCAMMINTFQKADSGSVLVEAALILSALLLLLFGIIEFGIAYWQWNTLTFAVEHAGRYMMVSDHTCTSATCATDAENCMRGQPSNSPICTSTAKIAWIGNTPSVCSTRGTPPATVTPPPSTACVYAAYKVGTAGNPNANPPIPPIPATVTLVAEYNMDWTVLKGLATLFSNPSNGPGQRHWPVIQSQVTVPLE